LAQADIRRPFTAEAKARSQVSPCDVCAEQIVTETGLLPSTWFYPVSIILPFFRANLHLHATLTRGTNGQSLGTFLKAVLFRSFGGVGQISPVAPNLFPLA
jgi:hypothetical protein